MSDDAPEEAIPAASLSKGVRSALLAAILLVVVAVDQGTKSYAVMHLKPQVAPESYFGGTLLLIYRENPGAFGSIFSTMSDQARWAVLTLGCAVLLAGVGGYLLFAKEMDKPSFFALTLILAGGIGNLIDRISNNTKVIDFLYMQLGPLHTNVFNVADVAITAGFLILVIPLVRDLFRSRSDASNSTSTGSPAAS